MEYQNGDYTCKVISTGDRKSKDEKYTIFFMKLQPLQYHGSYGTDDVSHGPPVYLDFLFGGEYEDQAVENLRSLGFEGESWSELLNHPFAGQEIILFKGVKNGYDRWGLPFKGAPISETDQKKLDRLFAKRKGSPPSQKTQQSETYQQAKAAYEPASTAKDDNIPF